MSLPTPAKSNFLARIQTKIDSFSQHLNNKIYQEGIYKEIAKKGRRSEILGYLKYSLTPEVG